MTRSVSIAVINVTDMVAEVLLERMADVVGGWNAKVSLFDTDAEAGDTALFNGKSALVRPLRDIDFSLLDLAFVCGEVDATLLEQAAAQSCRLIDLRRGISIGRAVVAGVNDDRQVEGQQVDGWQDYVRSPHPVVVCLAPVIDAISQLQAVDSFTVTAMMPASEAGNAGVKALAAQTARLLNGQPVADDVFGTQLSFNVIAPSLGDVIALQNQVVSDMRQVCASQHLRGSITAVTVSVFFGMSLVVEIVCAQAVASADIARALRKISDTSVSSGKKRLPCVVDSVAGEVQMQISVLPEAAGAPAGTIRLWIVADNIHRGRVHNALALAGSMLS